MRRLVYICSALLLTACQPPLERLRALDPQANDFASSLAAEYLAYSVSEAEQGNTANAHHFAAKGLSALDGVEVYPEPIDTGLPSGVQDQLAAAREAILVVLTDDIRRVAPQKLARAQMLFDCWQQQERTRDKKEIAPCADEFQSAIAELETVAESFVVSREYNHTLQFTGRNAHLGSNARHVLREIADRAVCTAYYRVEIESNASKNLSEKRAGAVRGKLIEYGVAPERIRVKEAGETRPVMLGGERSPGHNTLEITVKTFGQGGEQ